MATKYNPHQIAKECSFLQSHGNVTYYEHPYGGDEVPVIAMTTIQGERIAFQTSFYDPFNDTDTDMVMEEGEEAYILHTSDITDEEGDYE